MTHCFILLDSSAILIFTLRKIISESFTPENTGVCAHVCMHACFRKNLSITRDSGRWRDTNTPVISKSVYARWSHRMWDTKMPISIYIQSNRDQHSLMLTIDWSLGQLSNDIHSIQRHVMPFVMVWTWDDQGRSVILQPSNSLAYFQHAQKTTVYL